jgi:3-methylcrotonyl-CoA carboxylase alpha subunit
MIKRILIANRGEIACRVIKTARKMGIETVAIASTPDAEARHTKMADQTVIIGGDTATSSYLDQDKVIAAAKSSGADAIHPGYGFLSENPEFVDATGAAGLIFIGPTSDSIRAMGLKDKAKQLMADAGVPVVPGYDGADQNDDVLKKAADSTGYPVMIKARAGGGGKGMRRVDHAKDFIDALQSTRREAESSFGDDHVLIEKCIKSPRHIEVQVFADTHGQTVHLFERDCTLQRRHQKVIEEAPAPGMTAKTRKAMTDAAVRVAEAIGYRGAGTVEFIVDGSSRLKADGFWFMEMNTRLQVEHPVTEMITGFDLVEWQIIVANGQSLPVTQDQINISGHAVEARIYAEDAAAGFLPAPGPIAKAVFPDDLRIDHGINTEDQISPFYDPMIAKIITMGTSRDAAIDRLTNGLAATHLMGTTTNTGFLAALAGHSNFRAMKIDTTWIDRTLPDLQIAMMPDDEELALISLAHFSADGGFKDGSGWRMWGHGTTLVNFRIGATAYEHRLIRTSSMSFKVKSHASDHDIAVTSVTENALILKSGGRTKSVHYVDHSGQISVDVEGRGFMVIRIDPLAASGDTASGNTVVAPMTGVVTVMECKEGDQVALGDVLARMEAMKMEYPLTAPCDGKIESIAHQVGDSIADGAVLIKLEPSHHE